jgi:Holliday junction resolvase RuvA-like protein/HNH endonuclease
MMMDTAVADAASWQIIHEEILSLALARAANEHALCGALLRAHRDGGWRKLGFASFLEYAEQFAGTTPRQTMDRLRVAVTLEQLPGLDAALATGRLPFTAIRELARVITPHTEELWLAGTQGLTVGEIQRLVSGRDRGDLPDDPPRAERHRISLEVSADVYALFRDAQAKLRADSGDALDDEEVLRLMARSVLEGPTDEGRSAYQIAMTVCRACGTATQDSVGQEIVVDDTATEAALCDAQHIDDQGHARQDVPPATRRLVVRRQHGKCAVPACRLTRFLDVHHIELRSEGGTHAESNLAALCTSHHAAVHRGALWMSGSWRDGMTFSHADGSVYGAPENPGSAAMLADVHQALVGLGFKDREARERVAAIRTHVGPLGSVESALRAALQLRV